MPREHAAFTNAPSPPILTMSTLVESARGHYRRRTFLCDRSGGGLHCGRSKVDQSLVLGPRPSARPYDAGVCLHLHQARFAGHWRSIEISPTPMPLLAWVKLTSAAPKRPRLTLSRRCASVRAWMNVAGVAKKYTGLYDQAVPWFRRAIEANRNYPHPYFVLGVALGRLDEARSSVRAELALNPAFSISRARANFTAMSDDPTHLAELGAFSSGGERTPRTPRHAAASHPPGMTAPPHYRRPSTGRRIVVDQRMAPASERSQPRDGVMPVQHGL
jgi:hypothetical protein